MFINCSSQHNGNNFYINHQESLHKLFNNSSRFFCVQFFVDQPLLQLLYKTVLIKFIKPYSNKPFSLHILKSLNLDRLFFTLVETFIYLYQFS